MIEIEEIKKIKFERGDVLIVDVGRALTASAHKHLSDAFRTAIERVGFKSDEVSVVICEGNIKLSILNTGAIKNGT